MSRRSRHLLTLAVAALTFAFIWLVSGREDGSASPVRTAASASASAPERAAAAEELPPLPQSRPKVVEPEAGVSLASSAKQRRATRDLPVVSDDDTSLPRPTRSASSTRRPDVALGASGPSPADSTRATALDNGVALPPLEAPEAVLDVIRAGNAIARSPYKWGGGHGRFLDDGYDCSGSVSFALYSAGLIGGSQTSGQLMSWGKPGKGRWITVYANAGHVFMEVAGIRFDTSGAQRTGSRWQNDRRPTGGYVARHPPGL